MNFRTMLLASAAVMFTTSAFAEDFTNPFYLPVQGKVISDTRVETSRTKLDFGKDEDISKNLYASEELTVGVVDNLALVGRIGNTFDYDKDDELNNDHNFDYALGAKYNFNYGKVLSQVGLMYHTYDPQSFYGQDYEGKNDRWAKEINATVKLGYALDCGLTPYTSFTMNGEIDTGSNEQSYSWFVGAHKLIDKVALDGGLRYDFGDYEYGDERGDDRMENLYAQLSADYFVKDNFTVGAYGEYYLGGNVRKDVEYDYTVGLAAKVLF